MTDLTNYAQCITCRCLLRAEPHSCAVVTLQRADIVRENVRAAQARLLLASAQLLALFGRETAGEEFELAKVAIA